MISRIVGCFISSQADSPSKAINALGWIAGSKWILSRIEVTHLDGSGYKVTPIFTIVEEQKMTNKERIKAAISNPDNADDLVDIIEAACELESLLYAKGTYKYSGGSRLFNLRKALEGVFGHDLPTDAKEEFT